MYTVGSTLRSLRLICFTSFEDEKKRSRQVSFHFLLRIMAAASEELNEALKKVIRRLHQSPFPHIANPEGCEKRASVALILRLRPPYHTQLANAQRSDEEIAGSHSASLEEFLSQSWEGDPEILFIKRAGRAGDRWSGHTALPGGKRDTEDADDLAAAIRETKEEVGLDLRRKGCFHVGNLSERVVTTAWGKKGLEGTLTLPKKLWLKF